jgi:SpoVK/Ycf46/Vps4 family AAA+-type ATPase
VEGKKFGLPLLKGLLLVGLPGCGKSLICKAIGNKWKLPIVKFDPSRIFSSRVGDSESNMRRVLQIVERISPVVLFIDEVEKGLAGMQSSTFSDSGVTARVIGTFLTWMQENVSPVFVVATANNIQYLPPELISRFDETFFVNLPQEFEREEIFKIHLEKLGRISLFSENELKKLAANSKDLSGREIEQILRESMYDAYHAKNELSTEIILNALSKKTTLLLTMAEQLKYLLEWVGFDNDKGDGVRARYASPINQLDVSRVNDEIEKLLKDVEKKDPFRD